MDRGGRCERKADIWTVRSVKTVLSIYLFTHLFLPDTSSQQSVSTLDMVVVRPVFIALVCLHGNDHKQEAQYGNYFNASWKACFYRICESNEP